MSWDFTCPVCNSDSCVLPVGPKSSLILIIGDKPGIQEVKEGKPFGGALGGVLRTELSRYQIDMNQIRITNLWLHEPNKNEKCLDHGAKKAIAEAKGRKVILLIGSETVKYFCGCSVEGYNGLLVTSDWFPTAKVMAMIQPASAFHQAYGELRFAVEQFANLLKQEKLL
jgi:uracil-DNA glycosylase family 4